MMNARTRAIHLLMMICLALSFLAGNAENVRADADPFDIQSTNRDLSLLATLKVAPPLQVAIWEADILKCLDKFEYKKGEDRGIIPKNTCFTRTLPPNIVTLALIVDQAQVIITGTWATVDFNQGNSQRHTGSIEIDQNNMGRLISTEAGYAILQFYRDDGPDASALGADVNGKVVSFDYSHYVNNKRNDSGYGVLIETSDGCKMYGRFVSILDPNTLGTLFLARC